jgi:polar amino acid transport system permease protein
MLVQFLFWFNIAAIFPSIGIGLPFGSELSSLTQHLFGFAVHTTLFSVDANKVTSVMTVAIIAMGLHEVAYAAEVIRGGIASVDPSQRRAAVSLGLSRGRILRRIILPQAMRGMLPTLGNRAINIIKDSSLASVISLADLLYSAQLIYNRTFEVMPLLIVASLWYLVLTGLVDFIQKRLELRFGRGMTVE